MLCLTDWRMCLHCITISSGFDRQPLCATCDLLFCPVSSVCQCRDLPRRRLIKLYTMNITAIMLTLVQPPSGSTLWILGTLRLQANVLGFSKQVGAPKMHGTLFQPPAIWVDSTGQFTLISLCR